MATWPKTLPLPQFSGYSLDSQDATRRTDMESGAARVRRTSTSLPDKASLKWLLSEQQMTIFRAFWEGEWMHGAAWVMVPVKTGRVVGVSSHPCRPFPAVFKAVPVSNRFWFVEMTVEVRVA